MEEREDLGQGLAPVEATESEAKTSKRRIFTPEELAAVVAGVEKLRSFGLSEKTMVILENLAPAWNAEDRGELVTAKQRVIDYFDGSDKLKDYIDGEFQAELQPYVGISKIIPVANNIRSFYARRPGSGSKKAALVQVNISGTVYNVDKAFYNSLEGKSNEEKRELVLNHPSTQKAPEVQEIL